MHQGNCTQLLTDQARQLLRRSLQTQDCGQEDSGDACEGGHTSSLVHLSCSAVKLKGSSFTLCHPPSFLLSKFPNGHEFSWTQPLSSTQPPSCLISLSSRLLGCVLSSHQGQILLYEGGIFWFPAKEKELSWTLCYRSVIPASREAKASRRQIRGQSGLQSELKAILPNLLSLCLKHTHLHTRVWE